MRSREMMSAGGVTLAGLGVLVGLAIGSGGSGQPLIAPRTQPVEVRTEVIRKTVNVYRRAHPHLGAGSPPGGTGSTGSSATRLSGGAVAVARTRSSGATVGAAAPVSSASPAVRTASSGSRASTGPSKQASSGTQVRTRSSGGTAGSSSGTARSVSTRSSGGGGDGESKGGHDD